MIAPAIYNTTETIPADPVERSFMALRFFSFDPLVIRPSAKSANPSVWWIPVMTAMDATTKSETINGSRKNDNPKPIEAIISPIAIPIIGKICMYFATVPRSVLLEENIKIINEKNIDEELRKVEGIDNKMLALLANNDIITLDDFAGLSTFDLLDKNEGIFKE